MSRISRTDRGAAEETEIRDTISRVSLSLSLSFPFFLSVGIDFCTLATVTRAHEPAIHFCDPLLPASTQLHARLLSEAIVYRDR